MSNINQELGIGAGESELNFLGLAPAIGVFGLGREIKRKKDAKKSAAQEAEEMASLSSQYANPVDCEDARAKLRALSGSKVSRLSVMGKVRSELEAFISSNCGESKKIPVGVSEDKMLPGGDRTKLGEGGKQSEEKSEETKTPAPAMSGGVSKKTLLIGGGIVAAVVVAIIILK